MTPRLRATFIKATVCAFVTLLGPGLAGASSGAPQIDAGVFHACAFYPADGNVNCWAAKDVMGYGAGAPNGKYGQLADYLAGDAIGFGVGDWQACVLHATGNTSCWGDAAASMEYHGGDAIMIAVGYGASCVLTTARNVKCTGNYFGGVNTWQQTYTGGDAEWVVMSSYAGCIKKAGTNVLTCFGWNVNEPSWVTNGTPMPAAGGHYAMCMLMAEGNVDCMTSTYNEGGQTQPPSSITTAVDVDGNSAFSCAALANGDVTCWGVNTEANIAGSPNQVWSYTGVNAMSVAVAGMDVCWMTVSGTTGCASSTPDSYMRPSACKDAVAVVTNCASAMIDLIGYANTISISEQSNICVGPAHAIANRCTGYPWRTQLAAMSPPVPAPVIDTVLRFFDVARNATCSHTFGGMKVTTDGRVVSSVCPAGNGMSCDSSSLPVVTLYNVNYYLVSTNAYGAAGYRPASPTPRRDSEKCGV